MDNVSALGSAYKPFVPTLKGNACLDGLPLELVPLILFKCTNSSYFNLTLVNKKWRNLALIWFARHQIYSLKSSVNLLISQKENPPCQLENWQKIKKLFEEIFDSELRSSELVMDKLSTVVQILSPKPGIVLNSFNTLGKKIYSIANIIYSSPPTVTFLKRVNWGSLLSLTSQITEYAVQLFCLNDPHTIDAILKMKGTVEEKRFLDLVEIFRMPKDQISKELWGEHAKKIALLEEFNQAFLYAQGKCEFNQEVDLILRKIIAIAAEKEENNGKALIFIIDKCIQSNRINHALYALNKLLDLYDKDSNEEACKIEEFIELSVKAATNVKQLQKILLLVRSFSNSRKAQYVPNYLVKFFDSQKAKYVPDYLVKISVRLSELGFIDEAINVAKTIKKRTEEGSYNQSRSNDDYQKVYGKIIDALLVADEIDKAFKIVKSFSDYYLEAKVYLIGKIAKAAKSKEQLLQYLQFASDLSYLRLRSVISKPLLSISERFLELGLINEAFETAETIQDPHNDHFQKDAYVQIIAALVKADRIDDSITVLHLLLSNHEHFMKNIEIVTRYLISAGKIEDAEKVFASVPLKLRNKQECEVIWQKVKEKLTVAKEASAQKV